MADEDVSELDALTADVEEPEAEGGEAPETADTGTEDATGEEAKPAQTPEPVAAPPAAGQPPDPVNVPIAALMDERSKRQELEREVATLKAESAPARPDVFEDQDGAFAHIEGRVDSKLSSVRVELSRDFMMEAKADFVEKEALFMEMVDKDPALAQAMLASPNPAKFAYEAAVRAEQYQAMQDVDGYKAKLRAEVEAELLAKFKAGETATAASDAAKSAATDLPNLATETAATAGTATVTNETLEDILGR